MEHYFTRRALLENVHDQLISHHIGWSVILGTATRLITLSSAISPQITLEPMWLPNIRVQLLHAIIMETDNGNDTNPWQSTRKKNNC